jgi:hypothetical protein
MSNATVKSQDTAEVSDLKAQIEAMKLQQAKLLESLQAKRNSSITFKVSEKGAVSVYGMGRFPVTLYGEQWEKLLADDTVATLKAFINESRTSGKLSAKADKQAQPMVAQPTGQNVYRTGDGQTSYKAV